MSKIKLLPCPFCGGEAHGFIDKYNKYFTGCNECNFYYGIEIEHDCVLKDGWRAIHDSKEEAADAWNTRKPIDRIVEQFEKEAEKAMRNSKKAEELGQAYERHMIVYGAKSTAFQKTIEIVKAGGKSE